MSKTSNFDQVREFLVNGFSTSKDVEIRQMKSKGKLAQLLYIKTICDAEVIKRYVIAPFWETESEEEYQNFILSLPETSEFQDIQNTVNKILEGKVAIFIEKQLFLLDAKKTASSPVSEANVESGVQGPNDAFNEDLFTSLNLVRLRYKTDNLQVETQTIGELSKTEVAIVYDERIVNKEALRHLKDDLAKVDLKILQAAGELEKELSGGIWNIFPRSIITERPDRVVRGLSEGRIAVFVDKTAFVLLLPCMFSEFFAAMDDYWQYPIIKWFLKFMRYAGFFLTITLPGLYVGTISYNPEFFKVQLTFSIVASRAAVPYASYLEVFFMLLMMEFLTESSIRLPKAIGPAATTVGGLILGQAATTAGLVSNIMIIVVSVVAISNYMIPIMEMNLAVRVLKYGFLILGTIFGLVGIVLGYILLAFYLGSLTSFGEPYMQMFRKGVNR